MKISFPKPYLILAICTTLFLHSCTPLGVSILTGTAAATGMAAAQEGGLRRAASDIAIQAKINDAWFKYDIEAFAKLDMTVTQGRVLLTGVVTNPEHRVEAVRLAWQVDGVKQVINEIRVEAKNKSVKDMVNDRWITTKLRAAITVDKEIQSVNYSIDVVNGVVYLMGSAQNRAELDRVIEKARRIKGVKRVVSYVKLWGAPIE